MTYNIKIDRLILDGLPLSRSQAPLVQAAAEAELSRLVTEGGLSPSMLSGGAYPTVPATGATTTSSPSALGHQIARAVYGGIGP
ncbi:MAG TPA: hypothetical protein VGY53_02555 [Isosphaeraceae bacterium]|jgi:hypothetical protein|nr:hypothetical protein [Isosphaeraceae bacterium]